VEFALIASLLLLIMFGIIQFGIAYNRVQGLNSAGREGARAASIGAPISEVVKRVRSAQSLFQTADVTVNIDYSNDDGSTWTNVCTACLDTNTNPSCPAGCNAANLIRVSANVAKSQKYAIAIPLWANWQIGYSGVGAFRVEKV
jgi:Flp pilus assembly protein TadG